MYKEARYEILVETHRGTLPVEALLNDVSRDKNYSQRTYKVDLRDYDLLHKQCYTDTPIPLEDKKYIYPRNMTKFFWMDVEDIDAWSLYYRMLIKLALEHDLIVLEHQHGIYLISDVYRHTMEFKNLYDSVFPLRIEVIDPFDPQAARRYGLYEASKSFDDIHSNVMSMIVLK